MGITGSLLTCAAFYLAINVGGCISSFKSEIGRETTEEIFIKMREHDPLRYSFFSISAPGRNLGYSLNESLAQNYAALAHDYQ